MLYQHLVYKNERHQLIYGIQVKFKPPSFNLSNHFLYIWRVVLNVNNLHSVAGIDVRRHWSCNVTASHIYEPPKRL